MSFRSTAPSTGCGSPCSALMPEMNVSMSCSDRRALRARALQQHLGLLRDARPRSARSARTAAGPRSGRRRRARERRSRRRARRSAPGSSSRPRSSAAIQPAAQTPPSWVVALTWGTSNLSRTIVTPGCGTVSTVPGPVGVDAELLRLEVLGEVAVGDVVEQRRQRRRTSAPGCRPGRLGALPYCPDGMMLSAVCA